MLRLNFRALHGEAPTLMVAAWVRFCADGTLRGPDNYIVGQCVDGGWRVGGRVHRELDCEGPVRVRVSLGTSIAPLHLGPFSQLRTAGAVLYGDGACLNVTVPGRAAAHSTHEITFLSEGSPNGKA